jgi:hypothetical protein
MEKERKHLLKWKKYFLKASTSFYTLPYKIAASLMSQMSIE